MKKLISLTLACVLLVGCIFSLSSCASILVGKYENETLFVTTTFEFKLDGTVTYSVGGQSITGEYEIDKRDDGELEIELDFDDSVLAELIDGDYSFKKGDGYVEIGGIRYDKVKK